MRTSSRAVALAVVGLAGCAGPDADRKPVFPVEGRLTHRGEPMAGAMVTFHPLGDPDPRALRSQATADKDGRYRLTTYVTGDGAPAGEHAVTVYWPGKRGKPKPGEDEESQDLPPDRLGKAYTLPAATRLRAAVREQPNTIDFTLP